jgi:hypothetical protein
MGVGFKEVASLRGDDKLYTENLNKIDWSGVGGRIKEKLPTEEKKTSLPSVKKYQSIVVEKEALLFDGNNFKECEEFIGVDNYDNTLKYPNIKTLEGVMEVSVGDYIIKGLSGEFYPCKPEIFKKSYVEVAETVL